MVGPILLRIIRMPWTLIVRPPTIRLIHLWRIRSVLLLLMLAILAFIRIHPRLILIRLVSLPLIDPALISRHRPSGIRTRRPEWWLILLVVALLVLVPPRGRELIRPL